MARVVALYRYPLKGLTPEECDTLTVLGEGRIAGDRVLGVRFADTEAPDDNWSRKHGMLALINTPGLARLRVTFDSKASRLRVSLRASVLVDEELNLGQATDQRGFSRLRAQARRKSVDGSSGAVAASRNRRWPYTTLSRRQVRASHLARAGKSSIAGKCSWAGCQRAALPLEYRGRGTNRMGRAELGRSKDLCGRR